jgi:undecaprenyl diphosphate synthase
MGSASMTPVAGAAEAPYTDEELQQFGLLRARLPAHIAVIMDGNGRWANARGLQRIEGHRRGVQSVRTVVQECARLGIGQLTLYCLSSENWKRPPKELNLLMHLLEQYVIEERTEIMRQNLRFCVIGRRDGLSEGVLHEIDKTTACSHSNTGMRLCLAVNYGSRGELVDAVQAIAREVAEGRLRPDEVDAELISDRLYTAGMPDPDLVIRTASEMRLSNFLLWQISYAELWVTEKYWPEFRMSDLLQALRDYASRNRRFGGLTS